MVISVLYLTHKTFKQYFPETALPRCLFGTYHSALKVSLTLCHRVVSYKQVISLY